MAKAMRLASRTGAVDRITPPPGGDPDAGSSATAAPTARLREARAVGSVISPCVPEKDRNSRPSSSAPSLGREAGVSAAAAGASRRAAAIRPTGSPGRASGPVPSMRGVIRPASGHRK